MLVFKDIYDELKNKYKCFIHESFDSSSQEYRLYDNKNKRMYCYDLTIKELNLIFEYNGEAWHPNPDWPKDQWNNWLHPFMKTSADSVYAEYKNKIQLAEKKGFKVIQLWSSSSIEENKEIIKREVYGN